MNHLTETFRKTLAKWEGGKKRHLSRLVEGGRGAYAYEFLQTLLEVTHTGSFVEIKCQLHILTSFISKDKALEQITYHDSVFRKNLYNLSRVLVTEIKERSKRQFTPDFRTAISLWGETRKKFEDLDKEDQYTLLTEFFHNLHDMADFGQAEERFSQLSSVLRLIEMKKQRAKDKDKEIWWTMDQYPVIDLLKKALITQIGEIQKFPTARIQKMPEQLPLLEEA